MAVSAAAQRTFKTRLDRLGVEGVGCHGSTFPLRVVATSLPRSLRSRPLRI